MQDQPHAPNRNRTYVLTFLILGALTLLEFGASTLTSFRLPVLLVLAATKGSLVAGIYMHLKFDSRVFSALVGMGLFCAAILVLTLIILFGVNLGP